MNGINLTPYVLAAFGLVVSLIGFFLQRQLKQSEGTDRAQWKRIDELSERTAKLETWRAVLEDREKRAEENER